MFMFHIFPYFKLYLCNSFPRWASFCLGVGVYVQFPRAAVTKSHLLGGLKQHSSFSQFWSIDIKTTDPAGLGLTRVSSSVLPGSWRCWRSLAFPAYRCAASASVSVRTHGAAFSVSSRVLRTGHRPPDSGPALTQCDLVLTDYGYREPISKQGHVPTFQGLGLQHNLFRGISSPHRRVSSCSWWILSGCTLKGLSMSEICHRVVLFYVCYSFMIATGISWRHYEFGSRPLHQSSNCSETST
ncbi:hypothetical protein HJG60_012144 [Phyllostomus discolor]|uniref:Uncharacterized protein n=1 Tax=Phyllostomus discolor TaxID=89673 RepID=A0A833ZMD2_9CHIR|nr:hypothetical protein HJG60_012144 [Phyllostomus discolor]